MRTSALIPTVLETSAKLRASLMCFKISLMVSKQSENKKILSIQARVELIYLPQAVVNQVGVMKVEVFGKHQLKNRRSCKKITKNEQVFLFF